ncbi:hypothetical protein [Brasilonema sp. UFV-L1]|uniref:hypothetical protein n=1 Tax=Brasilonema sp. UFV-L1 TaxID=2234130 RepID=UPI00145E8959|nr:hypothetical protein [Brasilonema sp. UFV-L1]
MKLNEQDNTSTARIKPPKQVSDSVYIRLEDLESIREIELAKRRERIDEFKS